MYFIILLNLAPAGFSYRDILKFIDDGVNVMIALVPNSPIIYRNLCQEVGIELNSKDTYIIDHFNYVKPGNDHSKILTDKISSNHVILGDLKGKVAFHGIGMKASPDNYLITPVVKGEHTCYSGKVGETPEKNPQTSGENSILVASIQARNNARLTLFGSIEMLSDSYFNLPNVVNKELVKTLSDWTFHQRGVLRMSNITHHKSDGSLPETQLHRPPKSNLPETVYPEPEVAPDSLVYRIKDEIMYSTVIEEYNGEKWVPYKADDVQLEFVMLNPYLRHNLKHDGKGVFSTVYFIIILIDIYCTRCLWYI